jgi:hypothetical protein
MDNRTAMKRKYAGAVAAMLLCMTAQAAGHAPKVMPAPDYADVDQHPQEHVSVAAEPFERKVDFFRLDYQANDLLPVRVVVTNESDRAISLDEARIQFITAKNERIPAALTEEVERRMDKVKNPMGGYHSPIPLPRKTPVDKKVEADMRQFGFSTTLVEPHTTQAGFLWYDVSGMERPATVRAQIYVKMVRDADGKDLFPFEVEFDKLPRK